MTADPSLIETKGLAMRYPTGRLALAGASLRLSPGELLVVLGHNGCGKSTMLKCIAGLQQPTEGSVTVAGRDITRLSGRALAEARMALALVFQQARLVLRRSVLANVLCGTLGRHRNLATAFGHLPSSEIPHAMQCLDHVGLADFAHQRAGTLSGGQAQRAAIARALAQRPAALLADEPVASLDPEASEEVMRLLRRISAEDGLGIICVLHQPELARRYADRIVGMRGGQILFDAPPARLATNEIASLYEGTAAQAQPTMRQAA
jgi:phosphonate transport system ATP-binding protein